MDLIPKKSETPLSVEDNNSLYTVTLTLSREGYDVLAALEHFICSEFRITKEDFRSGSRFMPLPRARGVFTSILRSKYYFPLKLIGLYLGGRDHSTILMAEQRAKEYYKKDPKFHERYDVIEKAFIKFLAGNGYNTKPERQSLNLDK